MNDKYLTYTADSYTEANVHTTGVRAYIPLWGNWGKLSIAVFTKRGFSTVTCGIRPVSNKVIKATNRGGWIHKILEDEFDFDTLQARRDGKIVFKRHNDGRIQEIEQTINIPELYADIINNSTFEFEPGEAGEFVAKAIISKIESMLESVRSKIVVNLAAECRNDVINSIVERYEKHTINAVTTLLNSLNWQWLFHKATNSPDFYNTLNTSLDNNGVRINRLGFTGNCEFVEFNKFGTTFVDSQYEAREARADAEREARRAEARALDIAAREQADLTALSMMRDVLGKAYAVEFQETGAIVLIKNDYYFTIRQGQHVEVTDPKGNIARLCIHTINFSCNPIDEVVISVLQIMNKFSWYMKTANVFPIKGSFQRPAVEVKRAS